MLSVLKKLIMMSVIILNGIMLGVIMLNLIILIVVAPRKGLQVTITVAYMHDVSDEEKGLITITTRYRD
jgi:hypothetical protein